MKRIEQAVIFAGGRGERLRPLTDHLPKPMAPVLGRPFLDYLLQSLIEAGIRKILILTGYRAEVISQRYGNRLAGDVTVDYSVGTVEDLTGRRLLNAYAKLDDEFLLLYGDNYWPLEFEKMLMLYRLKNVPAMTTVFSNRSGTGEYGWENNVEVSENSLVRCYDKKRIAPSLNGVDIGFFLVQKNVLDPKIQENISFEETILSELAKEGHLAAHVTDQQYYYITTLETLANFEAAVKKFHFNPIKDERFGV